MPRLSRSFASETRSIVDETSVNTTRISDDVHSAVILESPETQQTVQQTSQRRTLANQHQPKVLTTLYSWPKLEPQKFAWYDSKHLDMPLRRDILHRAVIYEADATRQGTASTKWRSEVHGSGRKLHQQKGTGRARVGDKKSPIRRGGGVAFGPKPRDFSTELQRKVYDIAWRTALSYRFRKGELIILDDLIKLPRHTGGRFLSNIFESNEWGKQNGRSLLVTELIKLRLFEEMEDIGEHGTIKDVTDVDVKDLLETGRVIIEKGALNTLLAAHSSDIGSRMSLEQAREVGKLQIEQHAEQPYGLAL